MSRRMDPLVIRSVARALRQTGADLSDRVAGIRSTAPNVLTDVTACLWWWEAAARDLELRALELDQPAAQIERPHWHQGPPRSGASPEAIQRYFAGLAPHQIDDLVDRYPERIGGLDGAPPAVRYRANSVLVERYLADLRRSRASMDGRFFEKNDGWWETFLGFAIGGNDVEDLDRRIAIAEKWIDRQLLVFDPIGDGLIVEVLGELDRAAHLAVVVPGMGNTLADYEQGLRSSAVQLHDRVSGSDAAVVAWLGYDTPDHLAAATTADPTVAAEALERFLDGIRRWTGQNVHTSVIGHSYGSVVAGRALADGLRVDDAVFIGSPGVGVDSVSNLPAGVRVWAGRAPADPIRFARSIKCIEMTPICYPSADRLYFGTDPADPSFGAIRFRVGNPPLTEAHSSYFQAGSPSLGNLALIVTGRQPDVGVGRGAASMISE